MGGIFLRTVDAVHITIALRERCNLFVTADRMQAKSLKKLGLGTKLISYIIRSFESCR